MAMTTAQTFRALARFLPPSLTFSERLAYVTRWGVPTFESISSGTSTSAVCSSSSGATGAGMAASDAGSCPEAAVQLGRTVYGGAKSSFYQPTLYQKGLQLGDGHPVDYLRLEHRFAPTKSHEKTQLAALSPSEMIGIRPVARELSETIAQLAVAPYKLTRHAKEKTPYYWMLHQYRGILLEMMDDHGSWACVGEQIGLDLSETVHA
jgi:hypothetical protein